VNVISLHQEIRGIFVIKAAVEMQNNPTTIYNTLPKLHCYHSVIINVTAINRNESLIVFKKYGSM
jgi:hypothetical protein